MIKINDLNGSFKKKKVYFSQVSNSALRDKNLSLKAKGLYSLIQSYITIEGFILYKSTLKRDCSEKEIAFENAWSELKKAGYLIQTRHQSSKGKFSYEYDLLDITTPHIIEGVDNQPSGQYGVYNNTDLSNTDINNTDSNIEVKNKRSYHRKDGKLTSKQLDATINVAKIEMIERRG